MTSDFYFTATSCKTPIKTQWGGVFFQKKHIGKTCQEKLISNTRRKISMEKLAGKTCEKNVSGKHVKKD